MTLCIVGNYCIFSLNVELKNILGRVHRERGVVKTPIRHFSASSTASNCIKVYLT